MSDNFVHLRTHSEYSLVDSIVRIKDLVAFAAQNSFKAIALTDFINLFGLVKFYKQAIAAKVKPIIGCDVIVKAEDDLALTLLCQDNTGYRNLTKLVSQAYIQS